MRDKSILSQTMRFFYQHAKTWHTFGRKNCGKTLPVVRHPEWLDLDRLEGQEWLNLYQSLALVVCFSVS